MYDIHFDFTLICRSNKRFFEIYGITSAVQEMLRTQGPDNAFLALNLKSVLFNLSVKVAALPSGVKSSLTR